MGTFIFFEISFQIKSGEHVREPSEKLNYSEIKEKCTIKRYNERD
jgi:hypothetical protein